MITPLKSTETEKKSQIYEICPLTIIEKRRDLNSSQKLVYRFLYNHKKEFDVVTEGNKYISDALGMTIRTFQGNLASFKRKNLVSIEIRKKDWNSW